MLVLLVHEITSTTLLEPLEDHRRIVVGGQPATTGPTGGEWGIPAGTSHGTLL